MKMKMKMKKLHSLQIGDKGSYEGIECEITDLVDDLTIEISGMLAKHFYADFYFRNFWFRLLNIRTWVMVEEGRVAKRLISYYNFDNLTK